jgi:hypothetical protein
MQADNTKYDVYDIKRFQQVLDESYMMIPDSQNRFQQSLLDLQNFVDELSNTADDSPDDDATKQAALDGEWYATAVEILKKDPQGGQKKDKDTEDASTTNVDDLAEGEAF